MSDNVPDFSYSRSIDRRALLLEAAQRIDDLERHLGTSASTKGESTIARELRDQAGDEAEFADIPVMYKITEEYFQSQGQTVPYSFTRLKEMYDFYWLDIIINLHPKSKWNFNKLTVEIEFNPHTARDGTRPKAYQIFPDEEFVEFMKFHTQAEVQLGADLKLSAHVPTISIPTGATPIPVITDFSAGVDNSLGANIGVEFPQHILTLKADKIVHAPPLGEKVWWDLIGREFSREHRPLLSVIVQILKGTQEFKVSGQMDVARSFRYAPANLREAIEDLPVKFRELFSKGAPLHVETPEGQPWDMTRFL